MNPARGLFNNKRLIAMLLAVGSIAMGFGVARLAFAAPQAYPIPRAAGIYLTQRGQKHFAQKELSKILERNFIELGRGSLKEWRYDATENFKLSRLPKDIRSKLKELQAALDEWLGYDLNSPKFHAIVSQAGYEMEGIELGLHVDRELTEKRGNDGVVVIAELTIPKLRAFAQSICGYDSNNRIFGTCKPSLKHPGKYINGFGVYNPWLELRDSQPLRLAIPVQIRIGANGTLKFEAFKRDKIELSNLKHLDFASGQDRNLLIPKVTVQIGSQKMSPDASELRKAFNRKERELVKLGIHHLHAFIEEELPARLNGMVLDQLQQSFETVKEISPPGASLFSSTQPLKWGLRTSALGLAADLLYLHLEGYVSDPLTGANPAPSPRPLLLPDLKGMNRDDFDFAVVLNLDVVNQIIKLSKLRGGLTRIEGNKGESIKLVGTPVLTANAGRRGRLHATIELETDGAKQWVALSDPFQVELDVELRVEPANLHSFNLVIDKIDANTAYIPDRFIDNFRDTVEENLRGRIHGRNAGYSRTTTYLTDAPIELPPDLLGMPLRLLRGDFDQAGYLNLYFAYGDRN